MISLDVSFSDSDGDGIPDEFIFVLIILKHVNRFTDYDGCPDSDFILELSDADGDRMMDVQMIMST